MRTLYDTTTSKQTRRAVAKVHGLYTAREAAEQLGVDIGTLKYRRDHADAKTLWEMLGTAEEDATYKLLSESHQIIDGKHYYEQKTFDKFVKKYNARPEVQRARKAKTTWRNAQKSEVLMTLPVNTAEDIIEVTKALQTLFATKAFSNMSISIMENR